MLTSTINALEGRDVAVVDIPGAYLRAEMDNELHVVFRGTLAEMMVMADPALYRPFVSYETGKPVLYVQHTVSCFPPNILLATYGLYGFILNPYASIYPTSFS